MRQICLRGAAALLLVTSHFVSHAIAQQNKGRGGPPPAAHAAPAPAPHVAAPAPHVAAPAPHMAAPAPHIAAPAPHIAAAPRVAAPHAAPQVHAPTRLAEPRHVAPNIARPNNARPNIARPNIARRGIEQRPNAGAIARQNATPPTERNATRNATPSTERRLGGRQPAVVGTGEANRGANAAAERGRVYAAGRRPVLHNQIVSAAGASRDRDLRALGRSTFAGRFAQARGRNGFEGRRHGGLAQGFVLGWYGPLFWPYAGEDVVDYAFWPYGDDTFWPYAYDDVYDGIFGGYAPDYGPYANAGPANVGAPTSRGGGFAEVCSGQAAGLTDWPIERITQQVQPNNRQRALLDALRDATAQAVMILQSDCPTDLPSTPTARLAAMRARVDTMLQAVRIVRPALDKFYASLSDEQKERFNELVPQNTASSGGTASADSRARANLAQLCGGQAAPFAGLPIDRIAQTLHVDNAQQSALAGLDDASKKAVATLNANCPQGDTLTPTGRVAAMEQRLEATLKALDTIQPALAKFYGSLSDEQKARFDRMPRPA
jgi:hypothetical protein